MRQCQGLISFLVLFTLILISILLPSTLCLFSSSPSPPTHFCTPNTDSYIGWAESKEEAEEEFYKAADWGGVISISWLLLNSQFESSRLSRQPEGRQLFFMHQTSSEAESKIFNLLCSKLASVQGLQYYDRLHRIGKQGEERELEILDWNIPTRPARGFWLWSWNFFSGTCDRFISSSGAFEIHLNSL